MDRPHRILAKSIKKHKETDRQEKGEIHLKEHTCDVWDAFENLSKSVSNAKIDEKLKRAIQIAIICHDFGKVLPAFQQRTLGNKDYKPFYPYNNIPHSLFSVFWMNGQKIREKLRDENIVKFVYSAVAFHHWRKDFDQLINWSDGDLCEILNRLVLNEKVGNEGLRDALCENLKSEFQDFLSELKATEFISFNSEWASGIINGLSLAHYVSPPYKNYFLPKQAGLSEEQKRNWILVSGFLMRCDHFASFCEEEGENYEVEINGVRCAEIRESIKQRIGESDENKIWQFEKVKACKNNHVILIAPTGYGKTEFAFLWSNGEKFFYTLPLRSAVNQIFERAKSIFTEEKAGLLHSDADVYLLGDGGETDNLKVYDFARQLSHPVIISTGDQFFPYALKPPSYEKIYATMSYSRLVIDEVQAYNPKAAAIIVKFIEDMVLMGGKFLLMTATLPEFVKEEIGRRIGKEDYEKPILVDRYIERKDDFQKLKKHRIEVIKITNSKDKDGRPGFDLTENKITQILDCAGDDKRVLVILNTVKQAQSVYQKLTDKIEKDLDYEDLKNKIWLLHSRFTWNDREQKETDLIKEKFKNPKSDGEKEAKILIATQVVEASLDIDTDVLFTEIAPLDALVQRMGRVLRRIKHNPKGEVVEYRFDDQAKSTVECKNYGEEFERSESNVFIWAFENGLESGNDNVYDRDLLLLSLKTLKEWNSSNNLESQNLKDWLKSTERKESNEILNELLGEDQQSAKGKKKKLVSPTQKQQPKNLYTTLSEYDKYDMVKLLYLSLLDDHSYFSEFRKTLDILDAGYMSDRKEEAHKIFREIYNIQLIPENKVNDFIQEIKEFFKDAGLKEPKHLFTFFKKRVLSKFVVSDGYFKHRKNLSSDNWVFYKVVEKLNKNDIEEILEKLGRLYGYNNYKQDDFEKKLKRWLSGIFVLPVQYDRNLGITEGRRKAEENDSKENQEIEDTKDNLI